MNEQSPLSFVRRDSGSHHIEIWCNLKQEQLLAYRFHAQSLTHRRILILKLDHRGDFLIGLPALDQVRSAFPDGHITLICGSWNLRTAQDIGIANVIRTYDYFPEDAQDWNGRAVENIERFRATCPDHYDVAIDLRVDEDTRPLLQHVRATLRAGIGSFSRFPFLNIILPSENREVQSVEADVMIFAPGDLMSRMPLQTAFYHETDFAVSDTHLAYGPYCRLPLGKLRAALAFQLIAPFYYKSRRVDIVIEVVRNHDDQEDVVAHQRLNHVPNGTVTTIAVEFVNDVAMAKYEFRVFVGGRPRRTRLRFFGVRVEVLERKTPRARFTPSELHVGERLSLLVRLVAERVRPLYAPGLLDRLAGPDTEAAVPRVAGEHCIVVAPFSNSTVRDWPLERYAELVGLLLKAVDCTVVLVGSRGQASRFGHICRQYGDTPRLVNLAGRTDWAGLAAVLRRADLVIANNSGVAHLAAACGRRTLAIYSGSHQPQEWGPRGEAVQVVTAAVDCSPCGHERVELCPHDHLCMTLIEPAMVLRDALAMLAQDGSMAHPPDQHPLPAAADRS